MSQILLAPPPPLTSRSSIMRGMGSGPTVKTTFYLWIICIAITRTLNSKVSIWVARSERPTKRPRSRSSSWMPAATALKSGKTKSRSWTGLGDADGLAPINGTDGMIVFYSAEHGKAALDASEFGRAQPIRGIADQADRRTKQRHQDGLHGSHGRRYQGNREGCQHPEIVTAELTSEVDLNPAETAEQVWGRIRKSSRSEDASSVRQRLPRFAAVADAAQSKLDYLELEQRLKQDEETKRQQAEKAAAAAAEGPTRAPRPRGQSSGAGASRQGANRQGSRC